MSKIRGTQSCVTKIQLVSIRLLTALMILLMLGGCSSSITEALEERAGDIIDSTGVDDSQDDGDSDAADDSDTEDDSDTADDSETTDDTATPTAEVDFDSSLILLADRLQLKSGGTASVRLTANVKDKDNILLEGESISFSASSGSLQIERSVTDSLGNSVAVLSSPHNPSPRVIKVTASGGGVSEELDINVVGTSIEINGPENAISSGQNAELQIKLTTGDGGVLKNQPIVISSSLGNPVSESIVTTDDQGQAVVTITDVNGSADVIKAEALNGDINAEYNLKVSTSNSLTFTSPVNQEEVPLKTEHEIDLLLIRNDSPAVNETIGLVINRGDFMVDPLPVSGPDRKSEISVVTDADGKATVKVISDQAGGATIAANTDTESASLTFEFIAVTPKTLKLEASPSTVSFGQTSQLTVLVRDEDDNLVKNAEVVFHVKSDITTGGLQKSGSVKTNSLGQASVVYQAGESASGDDGVEIEAYIAGYVDEASKVSATTTLTVEPTNTRIIIGTGNSLTEKNATQYDAPFVVQVSDDGTPVAGAEVTILAYPVEYRKGMWELVDIDGDAQPDQWAPTFTAYCGAEDVDLDGELDAGEDLNSDDKLTPSAVVSVISSIVTTDENGFAEFSLVYPQNHARWIEVDLIAQTSQADGEAFTTARVVPAAVISDIDDVEKPPPGGSPFGQGTSCEDTE